MNSQDKLELKNYLVQKNELGENVDPNEILAWMDQLSVGNLSEVQMRKAQSRHELWVQSNIESMKATLAFGSAGIRLLVLVHGGAILALLTFLTNSASISDAFISKLSSALIYFSLGLSGAVLVALLSYIAQLLYSMGSRLTMGRWMHFGALICALVSFVFLLSGTREARLAFVESYSTAPSAAYSRLADRPVLR